MRVELWEKGDQMAPIGIDANDTVQVTYPEWKRLVQLDGWVFNREVSDGNE